MTRYKIESKQSNCFWRWRYTKRIQDNILIQILQDEENDSYMKFISTVNKWIQCRKNVDPHLQDIERKLYQTFDPYNAFIGLLQFLYFFADTMYNSPTLKALAAQSIVNNDITTVEIPTHLQEEMNALKKLQQIQQDIKYWKRKYELLQKILNQIDEDIFGNISEELIEEGIYYDIDELDESLEYYTECGKWFTIADHIVISMLNDKEDELEVIQNSLHPEYCNIISVMIEIAMLLLYQLL